MLVRCRLCHRLFALASVHVPVPAHGHPEDESHFCRGSGFTGGTANAPPMYAGHAQPTAPTPTRVV